MFLYTMVFRIAWPGSNSILRVAGMLDRCRNVSQFSAFKNHRIDIASCFCSGSRCTSLLTPHDRDVRTSCLQRCECITSNSRPVTVSTDQNMHCTTRCHGRTHYGQKEARETITQSGIAGRLRDENLKRILSAGPESPEATAARRVGGGVRWYGKARAEAWKPEKLGEVQREVDVRQLN